MTTHENSDERALLTVATYNVLATAYIGHGMFPRSAPALLDPRRRLPACAAHIKRLDADVVCLQEVEDVMYAEIDRCLAPVGYRGALTKKGGGKPDGCAVFARGPRVEFVKVMRVDYDDAVPGQSRSGHIAQLSVVKHGGRLLGIANTHLKWDRPGTPSTLRFGTRQMRQLFDVRRTLAPECAGWIICGDFNVVAEDEVACLLLEAGFTYSHAGYPDAATCNANGRARMIDFMFHDASLRSTPIALPPVGDQTPLPGPDEPSDHLAVVARFQWAA
ncbi:MAG: endonuclease/exonuclease/phosphatase family protein [Burkholderiales bacterium]